MCIRWCRTIFLQRGRTAAVVDVSDDLLISQDDEDHDTYGNDGDTKHSEVISHPVGQLERGVNEALLRLEGLYVKLLLGLRLVVKNAFAKHSDVLEAGTEVQVSRLGSICCVFLWCLKWTLFIW